MFSDTLNTFCLKVKKGGFTKYSRCNVSYETTDMFYLEKNVSDKEVTHEKKKTK